jgi:hypothetical protein
MTHSSELERTRAMYGATAGGDEDAHVYRLTIRLPRLWTGPGGAPGAVRTAAVAEFGVQDDKEKFLTLFLNRDGAREIAQFWRDQFKLAQLTPLQGAEIIIEKSNPVTWPSDGAS